MKELEDKESEIQKLNQLLQSKDKELTERDQILKKHLIEGIILMYRTLVIIL